MMNRAPSATIIFNFAGGNAQDNLGLLIHRCAQLVSVQHEENLEGGMTGAFIAIHKWMMLYERIAEGRSFFREGG